MHVAIAIGSLAVAIGALIYVIVTGRKTQQLWAETEANLKKAAENWKQVAESSKRTAELRQQAAADWAFTNKVATEADPQTVENALKWHGRERG